MRTLTITIAALTCAGTAAAQLTYTAGPPVAPLGSPIKITVSNDGGEPVPAGICYYVDDGAEIPVYNPLCLDLPVLLQPGDSFSFEWDQTSTSGEPVGPGTYYIVSLSDPSQAPAVQISAEAEGALTVMGTPKLGTERDLYLTAPGLGGQWYTVAASLGAGSIATCGGTVPLANDGLLALTLDPSNPLLLNGTGQLDESGTSEDARLAIPMIPGLAGTSIQLAFLVWNPFIDDGCGILTASEGLTVTLS